MIKWRRLPESKSRGTLSLLALPALAIISGLMAAKCAPQPERDVSWFLKRLRSVDHLPELEDSHTALSSTWDRSGGNRDGTDFKDLRPGDPGEPTRNVLLDVPGPGCIHRIFTGVVSEAQAGTRLQVFLDKRKTPVLDFPVPEFFDYRNGPLPYPLVFHKSYPGTLFPIPFKKHCLIQLLNAEFGKPDWNDKAWGNYWQVTYTRYHPDVRVKSLSWPLGRTEKEELDRTCRAWLEAESEPPPAPPSWSAEKSASLKPGQAISLEISEAGVIRQMRLRLDPPSPEILASLRLRIAWDKSPLDSVDVPAGYFFGHVFGGYGQELESPAAVVDKDAPLDFNPPLVKYASRFASLLIGVTETEAYCRFPMPFSNGAKVTLVNTGNEEIPDLRLRLDIKRLNHLPENWGRFHATWTTAPAATELTPRFGPQEVPGKVVLERQGRGKYVGVLLSVDWPHLGWWGEGDWLIWTDQEGWPPDYHGTGSEEYFNSGWCRFDRKAVSGFVTLRPGHPTVYTFHLNDAFQFQRNIRVVEEQMGDELIHKTHPAWTTTAYWYALPAQPAGSD